MRKPIKLLMSDWSGVLSDDRLPVYEANSRMMEKYGLPRLSYEAWLPSTTASPREYFIQHGVSVTGEEVFADYMSIFPQVCEEGIRPTIYPDALAFVSAISAKLPVLVISSHPQEFLSREAQEYSLAPLFSGLHGSVKSKADKMRATVAEHGIANDETIYIGDSISDIKSAKLAGIPSIAITTGYHPREMLLKEEPDYIVDSLTELKSLLQ